MPLGYGRIVLLEKIEEFGSITKAAKAMDISYRHAWELVDSMNRQAKHPLVESSAGGRNGGGARLTEEGKKAIGLFWKFYEDFQEFLRRKEGELGISFGKERLSLKGNIRLSEVPRPKHNEK